MFDINYSGALVIGGIIIIAYTFLGGFLAVWERPGLGSIMYENFPGFIANFIVILVINKITNGADGALHDTYLARFNKKRSV